MSVTLSSAFTQAVVVLMHRIGPRCSCACICAGPNVITLKPRSTSTTKVKKLASKVPPSKSPGDMHTVTFVQKLAHIDSSGYPALMQHIVGTPHLPESRSCLTL